MYCVIEVFGGVVLWSRYLLDFSVGVGPFIVGLSQMSSFSLKNYVLYDINRLYFIGQKLYRTLFLYS